jgi:hypothetical protein
VRRVVRKTSRADPARYSERPQAAIESEGREPGEQACYRRPAQVGSTWAHSGEVEVIDP